MGSEGDTEGKAGAGRPSARERVLEVATDLFYREGIRAVGVDTIVARSGVAKMSLYRNFPTKDDLVVAFLERRDRLFFEWWERVTARDADRPDAQLRNLVAATIKKVGQPGYRGCPFLNTSAEFPGAAHPARAVIASHKREVRARLLELSRRLGAARPEALTEQWIVLMDGVYAYPETVADPAAAAAVIEAAEALIAAQAPRGG